MNHICFTIPQLLSRRECAEFIRWGEEEHYAPTGHDYPADYRNNDRLVVYKESLALKLWQRLKDRLPASLERQGKVWLLDDLNPQFRGCRYRGGQSFARHRDGAYSPDNSRLSLLTVMLYLNDRSEFSGGSTRFYADRYCSEVAEEIAPQAGLAVVFDHDYWHDGQAVTDGTKYVLRTDILYRLEAESMDGHRGYVWDMASLPHNSVVTGSRDRTVRVWAVNGQELRQRQVLTGHVSSVTCLAPTPSGFVSGGRDRMIIDWHRDHSGRFHEHHRFIAHQGALLKLLGLPNHRLLSTAADNTVKLWDPERNLLATLEVDGWPWVLLPHDDGYLAGSESGRLLKVDRHLQNPETVYHHPHGIRAAAGLAPADGTATFVLGDSRGQLLYLDSQFRSVHTIRAHRGPITCLLSAGDRVISGGEDDGVRAWQQQIGIELWSHRDFVRALCLHGDRLVSASYDGSLQPSKPSAIWRTVLAANPGGASAGTVAAS